MCKQEAREEWRDRGSKAEWKLKERERPLEDQLLTIFTNSQIWRNAAGMAILETPVAMMENNQAKIPLLVGKWKGKNTRTGRENVSWLLTSPYFRGFLWMRVLKIPSWQCAHVCWMVRIKERVVGGHLLCESPSFQPWHSSWSLQVADGCWIFPKIHCLSTSGLEGFFCTFCFICYIVTADIDMNFDIFSQHRKVVDWHGRKEQEN